uniref:G-protein coupled receptors family 1 profile domain-containing protein n=1 Tax=Nannospalax galili TaxID=1026970 RepID=A0A8C6RP85_NANGA
ALIPLVICTNPAIHTSMYFFLANLSLLEMGYTCSVIPKMLQSLVSEAREISREACALEMLCFTFLGITECCLLAAMAFDCYMAICAALHHATRMGHGMCAQLAMVSWGMGCTVDLGQTNFIFSLDFCGPCERDHFFCDLPPILALASAVLCISSPFLLIVASYGRILAAVLVMPSPEGPCKALSTCSSHLLVQSITFLRPKSSHTQGMDKLLALFYTAVTSTLNAIIYSLQNKEAKMALQRTLGQK